MINKLKNLSSTAKILIAAFGIPLAIGISAFGYWTISPLFYDNVVNESLDDAIQAATQDTETATDEPKIKSVDRVDGTVQPATSTNGTAIFATGSFVDADLSHKASGTANLIDIGNENFIVRFEDGFETTNGPDLFVWLTKDGNPDNGYVDLGVLKGNVGAQNYVVPEGTDLSEFDTVIIWCRAFAVLFGTAELAVTN